MSYYYVYVLQVVLRGLLSRPELNGQLATVVEFKKASGRFEVQLLGAGRGAGSLAVRAENIETQTSLTRSTPGPHTAHSHTVHLPLGAPLIWCTVRGTGRRGSSATSRRWSPRTRPGWRSWPRPTRGG